ncbi:MAG: hypothetical protein JJE09_13455 [Bacteroidia bacterium]|nr:hypothetical protein [Bacteroidia bacterium]
MNREMTFKQKLLFFIGVLKPNTSYCMLQYNGDKYYCYRLENGRWESYKGPFDTMQSCQNDQESVEEQIFAPARLKKHVEQDQPIIASNKAPKGQQVFWPNSFDFDVKTLKKFL